MASSSGGTTAAAKLQSVTSVQEPPTGIATTVDAVCWNYKDGKIYERFYFNGRLTDLRLDLNTTQASTVEVDLEDADFSVLSEDIFAHWAFSIEDVSADSQRQFKTTRLSSSVDNAYLGDEADLEWVLGQRPIDFELGGVFFRLCEISSSQTTVTLQFEDRTASKLRAKSGTKSWDRSQHTRAQFVAMLCREAGVDYFIPELTVDQPVEINTDTTGGTTTTQITGHTISAAANLTVKGSPINKTQLTVANQICQIGEALGAPSDAIVAVLFDCIYESTMGTAFTSGARYGGVLGGPTATYANNLSSAVDEITAAYRGNADWTSAVTLAKANPGRIAYIGSQCTRAVPYDSSGISTQYEDQHVPGGIGGTVAEAEAIYAAYGGPVHTGSTTSKTTTSGSYAFTRGPNEDSWDCIQRLASEVAWYAFVRQNRLWYVSGNYLFQQQSQLSCEVKRDGVAWIDVTLDMGARDETAACEIYAETDMWTALPGMVVGIKKRGPATGKWMVSEVQISPLDETQLADISVQKPVPKRAEPLTGADDTSSTSGNGVLSQGLGTPSAAYQAAQELSNKKLTYSEAAGHRTLKQLNQIQQGEVLYDCSSSVGEVLLLAGFPLPGNLTYGDNGPTTASDWSSVMQQGQGKQMTVWISNYHMFLELNIPSQGHMQGNTVPEAGQPATGFRFFQWTAGSPPDGGPAPSSAYTPYHYPGT